MKKFIAIVCCIGIFITLQAQTDSIKKETKSDTTRITLGKKEINIVETEDGTDIKVRNKAEEEVKENSKDQKKDDNKNFDFDFKRKRHNSNRFKGHWDGISFGYNGFLNKRQQMTLSDPEDRFLSLNNNPTKSMNINIHFCQVGQKIVGNTFGLVTGLGIEFNNYFFENNNSIRKDSIGVIVADNSYKDAGIQLDKSKLALMYFTIPVMFEFQFPSSSSSDKKLWIAGGVTGSIKLNSHTKVVYKENGQKQKDKNRDDFNISALRYGFIGRAGYGHFYVYGNYYPSQFFEKDMGPEVYPFSIGIGFHID
jgi:hypothetical protein